MRNAGFAAEYVNEILSGSKTPDTEIADWADRFGYILVSKDQDFRVSHLLKKKPRKLIRVCLGNVSNADLETLLNANFNLFESLNRNDSFMIELLPTGESMVYYV